MPACLKCMWVLQLCCIWSPYKDSSNHANLLRSSKSWWDSKLHWRSNDELIKAIRQHECLFLVLHSTEEEEVTLSLYLKHRTPVQCCLSVYTFTLVVQVRISINNKSGIYCPVKLWIERNEETQIYTVIKIRQWVASCTIYRLHSRWWKMVR